MLLQGPTWGRRCPVSTLQAGGRFRADSVCLNSHRRDREAGLQGPVLGITNPPCPAPQRGTLCVISAPHPDRDGKDSAPRGRLCWLGAQTRPDGSQRTMRIQNPEMNEPGAVLEHFPGGLGMGFRGHTWIRGTCGPLSESLNPSSRLNVLICKMKLRHLFHPAPARMELNEGKQVGLTAWGPPGEMHTPGHPLNTPLTQCAGP